MSTMAAATQSASLPALLIAVPLLTAFLLPSVYRGSRVLGGVVGPGVLLLDIYMALRLWAGVDAGGAVILAVGGFAAPVGIVLYADRLAVLFVLATLGLTLVLWPWGPGDRRREQGLSLLLAAAACGIALSGDLFNMYVFYEILAVASYGLAASRGSGAGYAAAVRYLVLGAVGSALALLGIALIYQATGSLNMADLARLGPQTLTGPTGMAAFVLLLIGLGVKAELFPVNTWVPEVYGTAPARISGLLAGLVSKLAVLILLRIMLGLFAGTAAPTLLLVVGMLGVASGELAALRSTELRRVLSYSSIGQLGLVAIAFAVPGAPGVAAGLAVALHHLVVKPALFLLTEAWGGPEARLIGGARRSRWAGLLFVLLALSLIGVPPLPGFWAKYLLLSGALATGDGLYELAAAVVLVGAVVEAAYLFRIVGRLYHGGRAEGATPAMGELVPASFLGLAVVVGVFLVGPLGAELQAVGRQTADSASYVAAVLGAARAVPTTETAP